MTGRIETYVHSDSTTPHKGAAMVRVTSDTDFAARTDDFQQFALACAKLAYGALALDHSCALLTGPSVWSLIVAQFPHLEDERKKLERQLKETIRITEVAILKL